MIDRKVEKAKQNFWSVVDPKLGIIPGVPTDHTKAYASLREGVSYMLEQMPVWLINQATGMLKKWTPRQG